MDSILPAAATTTGRRERSPDAPVRREPPVYPTLRIGVNDSEDDDDFFGTAITNQVQPMERVEADSKILSWLVDICDTEYQGTTNADIRAMSMAVSLRPNNPNSIVEQIRNILIRRDRLKAMRKRLDDQYATHFSHVQQQLEMLDTSLDELNQALHQSYRKTVVETKDEEKPKEKTD